MDIKKYNTYHKNITFKPNLLVKNNDIMNKNDKIITQCDGIISKIRTSERKYPLIIGEYWISMWNLEISRLLNINVNQLLNTMDDEYSYNELNQIINDKLIDLSVYNQLILIQSIVLMENYKKLEITEELIESIYKCFYNDNTLMLAYVRPLQANDSDIDYFTKKKKITVRDSLVDDKKNKLVNANEYYSLDRIINKKTDMGMNEYKLFALANKCGFNRIGDSYMFKFFPEKTINRIKDKHQTLQSLG